MTDSIEKIVYGIVKPMDVRVRSVNQLLIDMKNLSFQGRALGEVYEIMLEMFREEGNTIFLGLAGSLSTAGLWRIIKWFIDKRLVDIVVSTGAIISEDIYDAMGFKYYKVDPCVDDSLLLKLKYDRFYDTIASEEDYRRMEKLIESFIETIPLDRSYSTAEFLYVFGKYLDEKGIDSILASAYRSKVPVFSPALVDSAYGIASVLAYRRGYRLNLDMVRDFNQIVEIGKRSSKLSAIYVGGGVPKDYVNLVTVAQTVIAEYEEGVKNYYKPLEYVVQFTTDMPQWGGLSGATLDEAVSWGKVSPVARKRTVHVDASIALPLVANALAEASIKREKPFDTSWFIKEIENHVEMK